MLLFLCSLSKDKPCGLLGLHVLLVGIDSPHTLQDLSRALPVHRVPAVKPVEMLAMEGEPPHHVLVFELEDIPDCCKIRLFIARKIPVILEILPSIMIPDIKKLFDLHRSHLANA